VLGVERVLLAGPFAQTQAGASSGSEVTDGGLSFGAVGLAASTDDDSPRPFLPHAIPRLALDLVLLEGITCGAFAGIGRSYGSRSASNGSSEDETPVATTYLAGGRVGALLVLEGETLLWPRLGLVHGWATHDRVNDWDELVEDTGHLTSVQLEAALVFVPVAHLGVTLGLGMDIGLYGSTGVESVPSRSVLRVRRDADAFFAWIGLLGFL
jgi:hypothetical protein